MDQAETLRQRLTLPSTGQALRVIGVTSGKGGVGKTNITANLAVLAAKAGQRVLIIDADLGLANVEMLFGITPRHHLGHLLDGTVSATEVLAQGPHGIQVLPAGNGLQPLTRLDDHQKLRFITAIDAFEEMFDLVLIDSGAGIGDNVLFFVGAAQEVLLVMTPEPTSLADAYAVVKVLSTQAGVKHFNVVVNQSTSEDQSKRAFQQLSSIAGRFLPVQLRYLGFVRRDENIHRAVMAQRPVIDLFPHSPASRSLPLVANALLNEPPHAPLTGGGLKFLCQRLLREAPAARASSP